MLILLHIEAGVAVPTKSHGDFQTSETVQDQTLIRTGSHGCVSKRYELVLIGSEYFPSIICRFLLVYDDVAAHQKGGVGLLRVVEGSIVINLV